MIFLSLLVGCLFVLEIGFCGDGFCFDSDSGFRNNNNESDVSNSNIVCTVDAQNNTVVKDSKKQDNIMGLNANKQAYNL